MLNSNATSRPGPRALAEYAIPGRRVIPPVGWISRLRKLSAPLS